MSAFHPFQTFNGLAATTSTSFRILLLRAVGLGRPLPACDLVASIMEAAGHRLLDGFLFLMPLDLRHPPCAANDGHGHEHEGRTCDGHSPVKASTGDPGGTRGANRTTCGDAGATGSKPTIGVELAGDVELLAFAKRCIELRPLSGNGTEGGSELTRP